MLQRIGRYEVRERIGQGAMADVYRAFDPGIGRELAIKLLKDEFRANPQYASRFLREAKAAGALSHPAIVTIYDVGEEAGYPYIAMELLDGDPLDAVIERTGKLAPEDVAAIGLQLAEALHYAHDLGVVHRDIKPSNIMLGPDGRTIKILDFGIARVAEACIDEAETLRTQAGQVLGTPRYMSPEQALGRELDGRSDLFSAGAVLYELVTGRRAFDGSSAATLALQITQQDPPPVGELAPDAPKGLQFIIAKLLAKRPERRYADGGQLAEAFRREQAALTLVRAEGKARRRLPLQVRLSLLMAAITTAVLVAGAGVVLDRQYAAMQRMALTSGSAVAAFVASNAALQAADNASLPREERDWLPVEAFVKSATQDRNIRHLVVVDVDGVVQAASDPELVGLAYRRPHGEPVLEKDGDLTVTLAGARSAAQDLRFVRPIVYAGRSFGLVDVTLSKAELDAAAGLARTLMLALALFIVAAVVGASYLLARALTRPILRLRAALDEAAGGDLDFRISHRRSDEFGDLFEAFNRLVGSLEHRPRRPEPPSLAHANPNSPDPIEADGTLIANTR